MFLRCSYFFPNLSLDVLIDLVLNQKNACIVDDIVGALDVAGRLGKNPR